MNKKIIFGLVALTAASAFAFQLWNGSTYRIYTDLDDGNDESGYWYAFSDSINGGNSTITFPVARGNEYDSTALDPDIEYCGGLCANFSLGDGYKNPYAGVGFNVTGPDQTGADVTDWGGLCFIYFLKGSYATLEIVPEDEATYTEYNNYYTKLPETKGAIAVTLEWNSFKQEVGWGSQTDQSAFLKRVAAVRFNVKGDAGTTGCFNLSAIGTAAADDCEAYGLAKASSYSAVMNSDGCYETGVAIPSAKASSPVNALLMNRTLSFTGITGSAKAEIVNLQGEVVLRGAASANASMDLASLEAGIYLVRVAGKSVNFSKKIVLK